jgi:hypothetical protein
MHNACGAPLPLIEPHAEYVALGADEDRRRSAYRRLFASPIPDSDMERIRASIRSNLPIGSEEFLKELEERLGRPMKKQRPGQKRKRGAESRQQLIE